MNNISRNNHFVPQMYLDAWKNENNKIWTYDLLVPNENCNLWNERATRSIASQQDFYIMLKNKEEVDDIEKYINKKIEIPASNPLKKAIKSQELSDNDWKAIINFSGCQSVRTPTFASRILDISKNKFNDTFQQTILEIEKKLNNMSIEELKKYSKNENYNKHNEMFPLKIIDTGVEHGGKALIKVETIIGKSFYLQEMINLINETIEILHQHEWKIIDLDYRVKIPTSDDPVICLNYYSDDKYDFNGGWNNRGSEIIFPISPSKIIYTKVGARDIQFRLDYQLSMKIKTIIVKHASRRIFSIDREKWITKTRKRYVNKNQFKREKEMIENWHKDYKNIEAEYLEHKIIRRYDNEIRRI